MAANGASVVRDPWVLLASGMGAGVAWAVQLPFAAAAATGAAMLAAAGIAKGLSTEGSEYVGAAPEVPGLRRGTPQAQLVERLRQAANRLAEMVPAFAGTALGSSVVEASTGAVAAVDSAQRLAAAIDAVDDALADVTEAFRASGRQLSTREQQARREQQAVMDRLMARRERLLSRLESAYLSVQEVRVQLLEVSAAMQTPDVTPADDAGLAAVSANLDQLRRGLEELESTAAAERLPDKRLPDHLA